MTNSKVSGTDYSHHYRYMYYFLQMHHEIIYINNKIVNSFLYRCYYMPLHFLT